MLSVLIKYLIAKLNTFEYLDKVYGLSSIVQLGEETMPAVYEGSELVPLRLDSYKSLIYIQQNGKVGRDTEDNPAIACTYLTTERYPLRLIIYVQGRENVNCESYSQEIAGAIKSALNGKQKQLETAANLMNATITIGDTDLDKNSVWSTQFSAENELKDSDILIAIDFEFEIMGDDECFAGSPCEDSDFVFDLESTTFCEKVDDCLNIPAEDGNYVLKLLSGVKSWVAAASGGVWGTITGTLSDQTDLQNALNAKQNTITSTIWGSFTNGLTGKTTPADTDELAIADSADSNNAKKLTWANLKATLKTYFDGLYSKGWVTRIGASGTPFAPADSTTVRFGNLFDSAPASVLTGNRGIYANHAGTIKNVSVTSFCQATGSNEDTGVYISLNNSTQTFIGNIKHSAVLNPLNATGLSITVAATDYIEVELRYPAFSSNPGGVRYYASIDIEKT